MKLGSLASEKLEVSSLLGKRKLAEFDVSEEEGYRKKEKPSPAMVALKETLESLRDKESERGCLENKTYG